MWPFKKKEKVECLNPNELNFTQLDITEHFEDHLRLSAEEWIETTPLNTLVEGKAGNLPPIDAIVEDVYRIASELSEIREQSRVADDGVYCPVCHIANTEIANLRTPCPKMRKATARIRLELNVLS